MKQNRFNLDLTSHIPLATFVLLLILNLIIFIYPNYRVNVHNCLGNGAVEQHIISQIQNRECKRILWIMGMPWHENNYYILNFVKYAVTTQKLRAPSLLPMLMYKGPKSNPFVSWLQANGVIVLFIQVVVFKMLGQRVSVVKATGFNKFKKSWRKQAGFKCKAVYGFDDLQLTSGYKYYQSSLLMARGQTSLEAPVGYKYYELVVDRGSQTGVGGYGQYYPVNFNQHSAAQLDLVSPLLLISTLFSGIFAVGAATFGWNFHVTKYDYDKRPQLVLLWPYLFLMSSDFRDEFKSTIFGKQQSKKQDLDQYL
eukprot:TRINITY_DN24737_c1_g1_i9.p1 TRINITY_DN24737_c1_g1~~TRINITY_DN24737_c1_g1_i9.p1  ORF type:complete len:329 (-),score=21.49 TRINITY_DN24737_c1_g1_i9:144-1073(-)